MMAMIEIPDKTEFAKIKHTINEVIKEIRTEGKPEVINDAVNWGSLHCCNVVYVIDEYDEGHFLATIDEASPDADVFIREVQNKLQERKVFTTIETEW